MIKTLLCTFGLLISLTACQPSFAPKAQLGSGSTGIINGTPVSEKDITFRMTVRVLVKMGQVWFPTCTASILSDDLILTAAHCVEGVKVEDLRIAFGAQPLSYDQQNSSKTRVDVIEKFNTIDITGFVMHPLYGKSDYDQDMALIRINGIIPSGYLPAPLLSAQQMHEVQGLKGFEALLVGYGLIQEMPMIDSEILRQTRVPARFEGMHVVMDQSVGSGGCHGDSGGPAYIELKGQLFLVGVTHGPKMENPDCYHDGVWGNPNFEKAFLNESAEKLGSAARFL